MKILVVDVGGTHIKVRATGQKRRMELLSGSKLTAKAMVAAVRKSVVGWQYHAVTVGYPGAVLHGHIVGEPHNLGRGWVGFDFKKAFGRPVHVINDAAMQALGSYEGKRMLFIGLGTGLGVGGGVFGVRPRPLCASVNGESIETMTRKAMNFAVRRNIFTPFC